VLTIRTSRVIRKGKRTEWTLDENQYSSERFPNYCNGPCYAMPISVYKKLYQSTKLVDLTPLEKLDDLILSGVLRAQLKIPLYDTSGIYCWHADNKIPNVTSRIEQFYQLGKVHNW